MTDPNYERFHKERLLEHARRCAAAFQHHDWVTGIVAGGSVSHGGTDRESDIDLLVTVLQLPDRETRASWLSAITGKPCDPAALHGTEERKWDEFHGMKDDPEQSLGTGGGLFYFTEEEINRDLARVDELLTGFIGRDELERPSHTEEYLADLAHGLVLYDANGFVAACQKRLAAYPEAARARLINYHWQRAEIAINEDLQRAVWRDDLVHAYDRRVEGARHLIRMLFAMNRRYFRKAKSLKRLFPHFPACPPHAWEQLVEGLREPDPMKGGATLMTLAGEIIRLVAPPETLERRDHWLSLCDEWTKNHGNAEQSLPADAEDGPVER
jgi:hypothetical protein